MKLSEQIKNIEDIVILNKDKIMFCRKDLVSINGVCCTLYPQRSFHDKADIKLAKYKAKNQWDIVRFVVEWISD